MHKVLDRREVATQTKNSLKFAIPLPHSAVTKRNSLSVTTNVIEFKRGGLWMNKTRTVVFIALLIALNVVLTRFVAIQTPIVRIGFGFIPIALSAMFFGPMIGGITAALSDVLGMLIFPKGAFFPGFTLSAFLGGVIYGLFLYDKPKTWLNIAFSALTISLIVNLGLNTLWISMTTGNTFIAIIVPRIIKEMILIPIRTVLIYMTWHYAGEYIQKKSLSLLK